jgi:hypothetical protein
MQSRKKIVEVSSVPKPYGNTQNNGWKILETKVKGTAAVQVSVLPLRVPRYSFRVGTAQFDEAAGSVRLGAFVTTFNYEDAVELLKDLGKKYTALREAKIDEVEDLKERWQKENDGETEEA